MLFLWIARLTPAHARGCCAGVPNGAFVVRASTTAPGNYVVSARHRDKTTHFVVTQVGCCCRTRFLGWRVGADKHVPARLQNNGQFSIVDNQCFPSLVALVKHAIQIGLAVQGAPLLLQSPPTAPLGVSPWLCPSCAEPNSPWLLLCHACRVRRDEPRGTPAPSSPAAMASPETAPRQGPKPSPRAGSPLSTSPVPFVVAPPLAGDAPPLPADAAAPGVDAPLPPEPDVKLPPIPLRMALPDLHAAPAVRGGVYFMSGRWLTTRAGTGPCLPALRYAVCQHAAAGAPYPAVHGSRCRAHQRRGSPGAAVAVPAVHLGQRARGYAVPCMQAPAAG